MLDPAAAEANEIDPGPHRPVVSIASVPFRVPRPRLDRTADEPAYAAPGRVEDLERDGTAEREPVLDPAERAQWIRREVAEIVRRWNQLLPLRHERETHAAGDRVSDRGFAGQEVPGPGRPRRDDILLGRPPGRR